jgi:hypothetical protein
MMIEPRGTSGNRPATGAGDRRGSRYHALFRIEIPRMSDTPPDRLDVNPRSKFHDAAALERGIGIRFNGEEKTNVEEYCVSEGWIRVPVGKSLDRRGNAMTFKLKGTVVPYFRDQGAPED